VCVVKEATIILYRIFHIFHTHISKPGKIFKDVESTTARV
jgi:hypothetical protein